MTRYATARRVQMEVKIRKLIEDGDHHHDQAFEAEQVRMSLVDGTHWRRLRTICFCAKHDDCEKNLNCPNREHEGRYESHFGLFERFGKLLGIL
jgi:hypothetical protein